MRLVNFF